MFGDSESSNDAPAVFTAKPLTVETRNLQRPRVTKLGRGISPRPSPRTGGSLGAAPSSAFGIRGGASSSSPFAALPPPHRLAQFKEKRNRSSSDVTGNFFDHAISGAKENIENRMEGAESVATSRKKKKNWFMRRIKRREKRNSFDSHHSSSSSASGVNEGRDKSTAFKCKMSCAKGLMEKGKFSKAIRMLEEALKIKNCDEAEKMKAEAIEKSKPLLRRSRSLKRNSSSQSSSSSGLPFPPSPKVISRRNRSKSLRVELERSRSPSIQVRLSWDLDKVTSPPAIARVAASQDFKRLRRANSDVGAFGFGDVLGALTSPSPTPPAVDYDSDAPTPVLDRQPGFSWGGLEKDHSDESRSSFMDSEYFCPPQPLSMRSACSSIAESVISCGEVERMEAPVSAESLKPPAPMQQSQSYDQESEFALPQSAGSATNNCGVPAFVTPTREWLEENQANRDVTAQVDRCKSLGIKLVVIDFDKTFVRIHTNGRWSRSIDELASCVRPEFKTLVSSLVKAEIFVAIASFSTQEKLIEDVMCKVFPQVEMGRQMYVRCSKEEVEASPGAPNTPPHSSISGPPLSAEMTTPAFSPSTAAEAAAEWDSPQNLGKQPHLEALRRRCELVSSIPIQFSEVLLIDDDKKNICIAHDNSVKTVWFDADCGPGTCIERLLDDLKNL